MISIHLFSYFLYVLLLLLSTTNTVQARTKAQDTTAQQSSSQQQSSTATTLPRRDRNLDFLDADTLAYYLGVDPQTGHRLDDTNKASPQHTHNVAVMFYAQWDRNSHALAPYWDHIATHFKAGTRKSNLILALFDCEYDQQHLQLCTEAAGVTHYPTLMYMSASRTFPHKPHLSKSKQPLPHTTQFPGNWQYDLSIMDWLLVMQGMSTWTQLWTPKHSRGWWQRSVEPSQRDMLPIGPPVGGSSGTTSVASTSTGATSSSSSTTSPPPDDWKKDKKQLEELVLRSSVLLDTTLFPKREDTLHTTDVFHYLHTSNGWSSQDNTDQIIRYCAMEITLDYCTRVTTHQTDALIESLTKPNGDIDTGDMTSDDLENMLKSGIEQAEPYCPLVESCILSDFEGMQCRPPTCPFQNPTACHYLSSCFEDSIQQDYAKALGISLVGGSSGSSASSTSATEDATTTATSTKKGWF